MTIKAQDIASASRLADYADELHAACVSAQERLTELRNLTKQHAVKAADVVEAGTLHDACDALTAQGVPGADARMVCSGMMNSLETVTELLSTVARRLGVEIAAVTEAGAVAAGFQRAAARLPDMARERRGKRFDPDS